MSSSDIPPPSGPNPALCETIASLDNLVVLRKNAYPGNHETFDFPALSRTHDASAVRAIARELCAMPDFPPGTQMCPLDLGITYELTFSTPRTSFPALSADIGGCEQIRGLGPRRQATTEFWNTLAAAIDVPQPYEQSLHGKLG